MDEDELTKLLESAKLLEKIADHLSEFYQVVNEIRKCERERCAKAVAQTHGNSAAERIRSLKKTRKDSCNSQ